MNAIPDDQLIKSRPSPIYIGEIYSKTPPTMDDITKLAMPKPRNDYILCHKRPITFPKTKIYDPFVLETVIFKEKQPETIEDCLWDCILKHYGFNEVTGTAAASGAAFLSSSIPKSFVKLPSGYLGGGNWTSIPSIIGIKSKQEGSIFNNKYFNNEYMHGKKGDEGIKVRVPTITPKRLFKKKGWDRISRELTSINRYRIIGRRLPGIGWVLLAADIALITKCTYGCYNRNNNQPMS